MAAPLQRAGNSPGLSLPKWQIALAIGAPVAVGLGIWYYRSSRRRNQPKEPKSVQDVDPSSVRIDSVDSGSINRQHESEPVNKGDPQDADETDPFKKSQVYKNRGNKHFKEGKFADAIRCYQQAIEVCPPSKTNDISTFYQNRAAAYEQLKNYDAVINDCSKALEFNSKYTKALHRRAKAYEVTKQLENCLEDITAVCILEQFQNQSSLLMADRVLKELGKEHAREAMANRKPVVPSKHFISTFMASFSEDPVFGLLREDRGDEPEEKTGLAAAIGAIEKQIYEAVIPGCTDEIDSDSDAASKNLATLLRGTFYSLLGEHQKALEDYTKLVDDSSADLKVRVNALVKRATLRMQLGSPQESLHDLSMAAELGPDNADVFHHRGQVYMLLDQAAEAMQDFARAVECNPDFPIALVQKLYTDYRLAFSTQNVADIVKAMEAFEKAVEKFPQCTECYMLYAQVLSDQQEFKRADEYFGKALERDPQNATAFVHRGLLQLQWEGDIGKAMGLIQQAIALDPKCEFAYETLGTIEVQRGNLKRAIELFDLAIPLSKTEIEMAHLFSLKDAALAQVKVAQKLGVTLPSV